MQVYAGTYMQEQGINAVTVPKKRYRDSETSRESTRTAVARSTVFQGLNFEQGCEIIAEIHHDTRENTWKFDVFCTISLH